MTDIAVELTVWDFELPRVSTLQTAFGSPAGRLRGYHAQRTKAGKEQAPQDWATVDTQAADEVGRHRINATPPAGVLTPQQGSDGSYRFTTQQVDALRTFVDTYHVNAVQTRSSWVAVRILPSVHTNPVWVTVGDKPVRASKRSAEWCIKAVEQCWSQKGKGIRSSERSAAKQAYDEAKTIYERVLAETTKD